MAADRRKASSMAHTPQMNDPVKAGVRSTIKPLSLTPDPRKHNADSTLQNVIVRRTEYNKLKDRNRELEEQYRAISTSYSVLGQDVKEVEAKIQELETRVKELETQVEVERCNLLESARRELLLKTENHGLKGLLSQLGGNVFGSNDAVIEEDLNNEQGMPPSQTNRSSGKEVSVEWSESS